MTPEETAWVAGIFEGEGTIRARGDGYNGAQIAVRMNDRDVIERLYVVTGIGNYYVGECNGKPQYTWQVAKAQDICEFLSAVFGHLGARRQARAREAINSCFAMPVMGPLLARDEELCQRIAALQPAA